VVKAVVENAPTEIGKVSMYGFVMRCDTVDDLKEFACSVVNELLIPRMFPLLF